MSRLHLIALCILFSALCRAQSPAGNLRFDLSKIGMVVGGKQICEDAGRITDYRSQVMEQIVATGPKSVPVLIAMIADVRIAKTKEPIICYWPGMAIGDLAFCVLSDLFTDTSLTKATIPGAGWDDMLGPPGELPAWEQLHQYIRKHGRMALRAKWQKLWDKYGERMFWDQKAGCFRLRNG